MAYVVHTVDLATQKVIGKTTLCGPHDQLIHLILC